MSSGGPTDEAPMPIPLVRSLSVWAPAYADSKRREVGQELNDSNNDVDMQDGDEAMTFLHLSNASKQTFLFPNFMGYDEGLQEFVKRDMLQMDHVKNLQDLIKPSVINWSPDLLSKLYPMKTEGDGNCLLHAASVGMWGIHDRDLQMRKALYEILNRGDQHQFCERWKQASQLQDTEEQVWLPRWVELCEQSTAKPKKDEYGKVHFEYLEQLHIFVLANVLKRPIILYGDNALRNDDHKVVYQTKGAERMSGIFLPLEWPADECDKNPLALTFHSQHFAALVAEDPVPFPLLDISGESSSSSYSSSSSSLKPSVTEAAPGFSRAVPRPEIANEFVIHNDFDDQEAKKPLVDGDGDVMMDDSSQPSEGERVSVYFPLVDAAKAPMELHMMLPAERKKSDELMRQYLNITVDDNGVIYARQEVLARSPEILRLFQNYLRASEKQMEHIRIQQMQEAMIQKVDCVGFPGKIGGCNFVGRSDQMNMCSQCFKIASNPIVEAKQTVSGGDNDRKECAGGCGFYGVRSNNYYCSKCKPATTISSSSSAFIAPTNPIAPSTQCRNQCGFAGSSANMGYCSKCFTVIKPEVDIAKRFWEQAGESIMDGPCLGGCRFNGRRPTKMCSSCSKYVIIE